MASANARGASCGRLCPMPPLMVRCEYLREDGLLGVGGGLGCGAPLASPSMVMVGTLMTGPCASCFRVRRILFRLRRDPPPTIIVNHDCDMIRVVERLCATLEGRVIEIPLRRSELPDQFGKFATVHFVAGPATLGRKIELIPPLQFGFWRQRLLAGFLAARSGIRSPRPAPDNAAAKARP